MIRNQNKDLFTQLKVLANDRNHYKVLIQSHAVLGTTSLTYEYIRSLNCKELRRVFSPIYK
jgi:hypothetical protein